MPSLSSTFAAVYTDLNEERREIARGRVNPRLFIEADGTRHYEGFILTPNGTFMTAGPPNNTRGGRGRGARGALFMRHNGRWVQLRQPAYRGG